jgi:hypothetical protein
MWIGKREQARVEGLTRAVLESGEEGLPPQPPVRGWGVRRGGRLRDGSVEAGTVNSGIQ